MKKIFVPVIALCSCVLCCLISIGVGIFAVKSNASQFSVNLKFSQNIKCAIEFRVNNDVPTGDYIVKNLANNYDNTRSTGGGFLIYENLGLKEGNVFYDVQKEIVESRSQEVTETETNNDVIVSYSYALNLGSMFDKKVYAHDTFHFYVTNFSGQSLKVKCTPEALGTSSGAMPYYEVSGEDFGANTYATVTAGETTHITVNLSVLTEVQISFKIDISTFA